MEGQSNLTDLFAFVLSSLLVHLRLFCSVHSILLVQLQHLHLLLDGLHGSCLVWFSAAAAVTVVAGEAARGNRSQSEGQRLV